MRHALAVMTVLAALAVASSAGAALRQSRWPASFERAFLVNCTATSNGMTSACQCELRALERRYTYRQLATIYLHDQVRLRAILLRTARTCEP